MNRFVFIFLLLATFLAGLFVLELRGFFSDVQIPTAVVQDSYGTIRRLPKDALSWDRAQTESLLARGDTISTGEDSYARIYLFDGGEVELGSDAMLVLGGDVERLQLSFISGEAKIRVSKNASQKISVSGIEPKSGRGVESRVVVRTVEEKELSNREKEEKTRSDLGSFAAKAIEEKQIRDLSKTLSGEGKVLSARSLPPTPSLIFPPDEKEIRLDANDEIELSQLKWNVEESGEAEKPVSFLIRLTPIEGQGKPRLFRTRKLGVPFSKIGEGRYRWNVRSVSASGLRSPASKSRWFELNIPVKIEKPTIYPVIVE